MERKSLKELKTLLERDLNVCNDYITNFKDSENPQIKEMYIQEKARKEAFEEVLLYSRLHKAFKLKFIRLNRRNLK